MNYSALLAVFTTCRWHSRVLVLIDLAHRRVCVHASHASNLPPGGYLVKMLPDKGATTFFATSVNNEFPTKATILQLLNAQGPQRPAWVVMTFKDQRR